MAIVSVSLAVISIYWSMVPLSNSIEWTCAKTGSQKGWNEYLGFIRTGGFFRTSTLERLMINQGHTNIVHDWVKTMGTEQYLVFKAHRHSKAPETYHFNDWLSHFTEKASASEKQRMMDVFLKGTEDDRREFLRHAEAIAFDMAEEHETATKVGRVR